MLRIASFATSNGDQDEAASSNGPDVSVPESADLNVHLDDEVNMLNNSTRFTSNSFLYIVQNCLPVYQKNLGFMTFHN